MKKVWTIIKYPLLIGILGWILFHATPVMQDILHRGISIPPFLTALIIFQLGTLMLAERFRMLLLCAGIERPYKQVLIAYLESTPYYFVSPGGIGIEAARYMKLIQNHDGQQDCKTSMVSALLADRFAGLLGATVIAMLGWKDLLPLVSNIYWPILTTGLFLLMVAGMAALWLVWKKFPEFHTRTSRIMRLYTGHPWQLFLAFVYSIITQGSVGLTVYFLAIATGVTIDPLTVIWVVAAGMVLMVIPVSVLGFHLTDISLSFLFILTGQSLSDAAYLVLLNFVLRIWLAVQGIVLEIIPHAYSHKPLPTEQTSSKMRDRR